MAAKAAKRSPAQSSTPANRVQAAAHRFIRTTCRFTEKIRTIAQKLYGAADIALSDEARKTLQDLEKLGYGNLPVCMAKTQYSLSDDPKALGRPEGFTLNIREVQIAAGAGFVIAITGTIMKMPGLPKTPASNNIDVDKDGNISGLF